MTTPAALFRPRWLLMALLAATAAVHGWLLFRLNVNWDEFYYLSFVHDYAGGRLANPLQTFHVHLFGWLTRLGWQEVEQVLAGRAAYLLLLGATCGCVYQLARRIASVDAALLAALCCAGYSNILYHGTSFRTDGLAVFLLMSALVLTQARVGRWPALIAAGVLAALAGLVTIKSLFFLPTLGLLLVLGGARGRTLAQRAADGAVFALALGVAALSLYWWHRAAIAGAIAPAPAVAYLGATANKVIQTGGLFPRPAELHETVRGNLLQWGLVAFGVFELGRRLVSRGASREATPFLALVLPLGALCFYRNSFAYFYAMIMPPALVLCAPGFDAVVARFSEAWGSRGVVDGQHRSAQLSIVIPLGVGMAVAVYGWKQSADLTRDQRTVIAAVHQMFPRPVAYIDRNGMIASFPKVGPFMSGWGMESYRAAAQPVFPRILRTHAPQFLITNSPDLALAFPAGRTLPPGRLLPKDAVVLRGNFVPHWGPVFVAGFQAELCLGCEVKWHVLAPGAFRLESRSRVLIDGVPYDSGSIVRVEAGTVALSAEQPQHVVLRTAEAGRPPDQAAPRGQLYRSFPPAGPRRYIVVN